LTFTAQNVPAGSTQNLPDMGDSAGGVVTPEFERRLGQAIMRQVRQSTDVITDPEVESYIQSIGYQLVSNSDDNQIQFIFFIVNNSAINAFAMPGGVVGINSGVILNTDSESELASVMAHEIAHVTQRHMARTYEAADKFSLPMMAAMVGAIVLGALNPQAGQAAIAAVAGFSAQYQINFTRANEEEADRIGMQLLVRSGFDPYGMPRFFIKLQQFSRYYNNNAPEFLQTHPLTTTRIADTIARAEQYPLRKYPSSISYKLIRARLKSESFESPKDAVKFFESSLETGGFPDMESARYGYALALTRANDVARAQEQLDLLLKDDEENITYQLAAARLESAQRNYSAATGIYQELHKLYPDYWPVVNGYTRALLDAKQPVRALDLIRNYGRNHEHSLAYYDLLSQAEAETGSPAEAGIAKAEYYYLTGGTQLAIERLKFAQSQTDLNYFQLERIKARLEQLEYELTLEKELNLLPEG
jgi:predicted Zn-dependent protease